MILWVIGAGGLFGSAIVRAARERRWRIFSGSAIKWSDPAETVRTIQDDARRLARGLGYGDAWGIVWAAGQATTVSGQHEADKELSVFTQCLMSIKMELGARPDGAFLLASSAGGVYAGSDDPPFSSLSRPNPVGVYGNLKLEQEIACCEVLAGDMRVVITRIANIYGPGQNMDKLQGLVSRLALSAVTKQTLTMFVPLDALRDYIYVEDAARVSLQWLSESAEEIQIRIVASGSAFSLAFVIAQMNAIAHIKIPIALGMHPSSSVQPHDLRLRPDWPSRAPQPPLTPLPTGMRRVFESILIQHQVRRLNEL